MKISNYLKKFKEKYEIADQQFMEAAVIPYSTLSSPPLNDRHFAKLGGGD